MARSGRDPAQFARDLLAHLRHLLVTQTIGEVPDTFVVTATDEGRIAAQAQAIGAATLVRTIDELAAALTAVREGDDARMAVEIALLKAARPDLDPSAEGLLRRVERLEKGMGGGGPGVLSEARGALRAAARQPSSTPPTPSATPGSHRRPGRASDPSARPGAEKPRAGESAEAPRRSERAADRGSADDGRGRLSIGREPGRSPAEPTVPRASRSVTRRDRAASGRR